MSNEKLKLMQTPKRAQIGGHMVTVFLTDYDEGSDSYFGEAHRNRSMNVGDKTPVVESIPGLRPYPYASRPDYAFQFVEMGEDEQPLIDIASRNATGHHQGPEDANKPIGEVTDGEAQPSPQTESREDRKKRKREGKG